MIPLLFVAAFATLTLLAGLSDLRALVIPNRLVGALLALWAVFAVLTLEPEAIGLAAALAGLVFLAGFALFACGAMGGGDVKLFAAVALWAGPAELTTFLVATTLAGAALALLLRVRAADRALAPLRAGWPLDAGPAAMPYGVAIAAGALAIAPALAGAA